MSATVAFICGALVGVPLGMLALGLAITAGERSAPPPIAKTPEARLELWGVGADRRYGPEHLN